MKAGRSEILATVIVCALALSTTAPATAQSGSQIGISKSQATWIIVGIGAIGAGIGVGVYYAVHHNHSLTGCAVSGANGLEIQNKGDQQTYALVGQVDAIKPGERIRVSGKRARKTAGPVPQFLVERLSKGFGPCLERHATP